MVSILGSKAPSADEFHISPPPQCENSLRGNRVSDTFTTFLCFKDLSPDIYAFFGHQLRTIASYRATAATTKTRPALIQIIIFTDGECQLKYYYLYPSKNGTSLYRSDRHKV